MKFYEQGTRFFVKLKIANRELDALVDAGSTKSILGEEGIELTTEFNQGIEPSEVKEFTKTQMALVENFTRKKLGATHLAKHTIDVGDHLPIKQKSPVLMVRKSNRSYRLCINFREINRVTKKDAFPLPPMTKILDKLQKANYISTIDLDQAFHQVPLDEKSKELTAFTVPGRGLSQFTQMHFELTNAPATFQRLIHKVIGPELEPHVFAYLYDVIIVSETFEDYLKWLKEVLDRLAAASLSINPEKCLFFRSEIKYLGFLINNEGAKVDPSKLAPILDLPAPRNIRKLRSFLGSAGRHRRFIPSFATVAEPIFRLLKNAQPFNWQAEQEDVFQAIKTA